MRLVFTYEHSVPLSPFPIPSNNQLTMTPINKITTTLLPLLLLPLLLTSPISSKPTSSSHLLPPITRNGTTLLLSGKPWKAVGPNIYWLGLDENIPTPDSPNPPYNPSYPAKERVREAMAVINALGGTMVRAHTLGVSTGNPSSIWPDRQETNEEAFESVDWAVYQAGLFGVRVLVPLVDNYDYYHGGKYDFLRWSGYNLTQEHDGENPDIQKFYTDDEAVGLFKEYVETVLTHRNKYTNLTYAEDPTIFAYETGNELQGPIWGDKACPSTWTRTIAQHIRSLAPDKLIFDGTYGINTAHLDIEEIDVYSDHFYPLDVKRLRRGIEEVRNAGKVYFAGEYDWVGLDGGDGLEEFFDVLESEGEGVAGDAFWSLFGRDGVGCETFVDHDDGFTLRYGNPDNSAYTNSRIKLIRRHFIAMSQGRDVGVNATLPVVSCPAPSPGDGIRRGY
ncbi:glycoside hydrolase superfamily [Poronia punctata]|nr:glycoside hydrolase superfamily [Poronia punctata]